MSSVERRAFIDVDAVAARLHLPREAFDKSLEAVTPQHGPSSFAGPSESTSLLPPPLASTELHSSAHVVHVSVGRDRSDSVLDAAGRQHSDLAAPLASPHQSVLFDDERMQVIDQPQPKQRRVRFAPDVVSNITFETQRGSDLLMRIQYRRPVWSYWLAGFGAALFGLAWALICDDILDVGIPGHTSKQEALFMALLLYSGSSVATGLVSLVIHMSNKDWHNMKVRYAMVRLLSCAVCGGLSRLLFALSLGFAVSTSYVTVFHSLPLILMVIYKFAGKQIISHLDLLGAAFITAGCSVVLAGDGDKPGWDLAAGDRWVALVLSIIAAAFEAAHRSQMKKLRPFYSVTFVAMARCVLATAFLILPLVAFYPTQFSDRIQEFTAHSGIRLVAAVVCTVVGMFAESIALSYFDALTSVAIASLSTPSVVLFFRLFDLPRPPLAFDAAMSFAVIAGVVLMATAGREHRQHMEVQIPLADAAGVEPATAAEAVISGRLSQRARAALVASASVSSHDTEHEVETITT